MSIDVLEQAHVRIRYWRQDTIESGHWVETDLMPRHVAEQAIAERWFARGEIVTPDHIPDTTKMMREWVGLTDEEIANAVGSPIDEVYLADFRKVEAKLKEKNHG